jgi:UDP:flavonoid glycosyltransferase YjiC (YdhE family)
MTAGGKRVLVVSLQVGSGGSKGHLNPLVGVAQHLMIRGHHVSWLPLPAAFGAADRAQLTEVGVELVEPPAMPPGVVPGNEELARIGLDPARIWEAYRSFLLAPVPHLLDDVGAELRRLRPDVALVDTMSYTGIIACEQAGVAWVGACAGLKLLHPPGFSAAYRGDMSAITAPRAELFSRYGLDPDFRLFECPSPTANVVFGTAELVGDLRPPRHTRLVGPTIAPRPRGDETTFPFERIPDDRPLVYAAFGSVHTQLRLDGVVDALAGATAKLGATLVVSSEAMARRADELPDHVIAVRYTPQLEMLARADAFVTHGGANSVMEGMYHGVPLLVVPLTSDQPLQAQLVERAGAGIAVERADLTTESALAALGRLLDRDGEIRRTVARIQRSYRAADGARAAAAIVEETARAAPSRL